jgi:hypothetical protein
VRASPPKIATTTVMRAMSARFLRLRTARFDTVAFAVVQSDARVIARSESRAGDPTADT